MEKSVGGAIRPGLVSEGEIAGRFTGELIEQKPIFLEGMEKNGWDGNIFLIVYEDGEDGRDMKVLKGREVPATFSRGADGSVRFFMEEINFNKLEKRFRHHCQVDIDGTGKIAVLMRRAPTDPDAHF